MGKRHDKEWLFKLAKSISKPAMEGSPEQRMQQPPPLPPEPEFRFSPKEIAMSLIATFLAVGGFASDDPWIVVPCLVFSWIVFAYVCVKHSGAVLSRAMVFALGSIFLICLGIRLYIRSSPHAETLQLLPPPPNVAILAKCGLAPLPVTIAPHGTIRVVAINEHAFRSSNNWGVEEIENNSSDAKQWPDKQKMREAQAQHDPAVIPFKCEVSNHGTTNLVDVALPLHFWFGNNPRGEQNAVKYAVTISPMDAGSTVDVYFVNDCPLFAVAVIQPSGTTLVAGESSRRSVPINLPNRTPIDPILMWIPATTHLVGATACK